MREHEYSTDEVREVDTGSFTISYRAHVNAPVEQLWSLAVNPYRHHELDGSDSLSSNVRGPEILTEGDTFNIWMRRLGVPYTVKMHVLISEPHHQIAWQHPSKHVWHWVFEPADDGGTWVTETFDYRQVSPLMLRLWKKVGIFDQNARDIRATLQQLQDRYAKDVND